MILTVIGVAAILVLAAIVHQLVMLVLPWATDQWRWAWEWWRNRDDWGEATEAEVIEHFEILMGDTVVVPIVPGRRAPDVEPVAIGLGGGPDLAMAQRAGEFAYLQTYIFTSLCARQGPGRHRAVGLTDPNRAALKAPTQAFAALVLEETGFELVAIGPREAELQCVRSEGWAQDALPIEVTR